MQTKSPCWPHAPKHQLSEQGTFIVTASTFGKEHFFKGAKRLSVLQRGLLKVASDFGWQLEAWCVFSNHYHFVAHSPSDATDSTSLSEMIKLLHVKLARWVNKLDNTARRRVWHNYWETRLTFQKSYLVRLNYVHQNAVKHGLVRQAHLYPWCSASWFEREAPRAMVETIYNLKTDRVTIEDDYAPSDDWR